MNAIGATFIILMALAVLVAPRRWAVIAVMATVCYMTRGQHLIVAGFNFFAIRIILFAGLVRCFMRGEFKHWRMNEVDWALVLYAAAMTVVPTLRTGSSAMLVYRLGAAYDIVLSYFVFRCLLLDADEVTQFLKWLAVLITPLAILMVLEAFNGQNPFRALGGIAYESDIVRSGHLRCEGSFSGPITAGIFGATLLPLFFGLFRASAERKRAVLGLLAAAAITVASHSSGPLVALICGIIAWMMWQYRQKMRMARWGILVVLILLQLVMKAPVWFLFSRLSDLTGGDGYHRSVLIDSAIHNFGDWWLLGTDETGDWEATHMTDGSADLTNAYVAAGVNGGIIALAAFVLILVRCFRALGVAMARVRDQSPKAEILFWALGCTLFAHVVTLFSISYYDQMYVPWWGGLAIISSVTSGSLQTQTAAEPAQEFSESWPAGQTSEGI